MAGIWRLLRSVVQSAAGFWELLLQRADEISAAKANATKPTSASNLGRQGERLAAQFFRTQGFRVVAQPFRHPLGEIDLVVMQGKTIVFVEVKTRTTRDRGEPWEAVNTKKQRRMAKSAQAYLQKHRMNDFAARFDVIAITWRDGQTQPDPIEHFPSAFDSPF